MLLPRRERQMNLPAADFSRAACAIGQRILVILRRSFLRQRNAESLPRPENARESPPAANTSAHPDSPPADTASAAGPIRCAASQRICPYPRKSAAARCRLYCPRDRKANRSTIRQLKIRRQLQFKIISVHIQIRILSALLRFLTCDMICSVSSCETFFPAIGNSCSAFRAIAKPSPPARRQPPEKSATQPAALFSSLPPTSFLHNPRFPARLRLFQQHHRLHMRAALGTDRSSVLFLLHIPSHSLAISRASVAGSHET